MNQRLTPGGPYSFALYYEPAEIERICENALKGRNLLPSEPQPVRIERFIEKQFPLSTTYYDDVGVGILGGIGFRSDGEVEAVFVSKALADDPSAVAQRRVRATFAHEAGHGLLHGCLFIDDGQMDLLASDTNTERRFRCREEDVASAIRYTQTQKWWEVQANRAISGLLLPRDLVQMVVRPFGREADPFGGLTLIEKRREAAVREVAECFDVNPMVARIGLERMFPANAFDGLQ